MAGEIDELKKKKSHHARQAGVKAQKKKIKAKKEAESRGGVEETAKSARQRNPKAFAISSLQKAERNFRRKEDLTAKKQHIPIAVQTPQEPPPVLIGIVGPPKVGKSTLIKDLIKNFTRTNITDIRGPITVVTSKKRRITLLECNNDMNSMIDVAKCADFVLLLCDASFGFEMEIFEFLNICQVHGMPKIMGVLTHLDMIRNAKQMRKRKKELKHRFWTEVYNGAKLFYLSGILHGEYLRNDVKNLGRFISVMKFRPLQWRGAHSYVVVDRVEDVTNTELVRQNPKTDRDVILYGYVRGVPLKKELMVHIAGLGDMRINELSAISDPCPLPGTEKKRTLLEKERLLYAPMSGVGGIVYDKDAVYIELQGSHSHKEKNDTTAEQEQLLGKLIEKKLTVDTQIEEQEFKLFSGGLTIKSKNFSEDMVMSQGKSKEKNDDDVDNSDEEYGEGDDDTETSDDDTEISDEDDNDNKNSGKDDDDDEDDDDDQDDGNEEVCDKIHKIKKFKWRDSISGSDNESKHLTDDNDSADEEYQSFDDFKKTKYSKKESESDECISDGSDNQDTLIANDVSWKNDLAQKARDAFLDRCSTSRNIMRLVYGCYTHLGSERNRSDDANAKESDSDEEIGGLFKAVTKKQSQIHKDKDIRDKEEICLFEDMSGATRDWLETNNKEILQNCFVTGKWKSSEDAENLLHLDALSDAESEIYGDFEDLETKEKHTGQLSQSSKSEVGKVENSIDEPVTENNVPAGKRKMTRVEEENMTKAELMAKKIKLKSKFDAEYDNKETKEDNGRIVGDHAYYESLTAEAQKQSDINRNEFANLDEDMRLQIEGYRAGLYVRLGFKNMPAEFIENFDPSYPVLIGGLNMAEENIGYVNCKVKKHRWYKKILKTGDPLIISMGWRRFQTVPVYAIVDDNLRHRYLKYTPEHVTCSMTFWGPIIPQGTGFLALQSVRNDLVEMQHLGFRIAATGCVTELDKSVQIMKKLKLVGYPFKIYKKTAFIKGMFNTALEVAKFEGAKIKTVSGIRGQIKKAHNTPEGSFRATFEDKILLSDIVFCRTWYRVDVQKFYTPITSLLLSPEEKTQWQGMKTLGQLKRERGIQNAAQLDSLYTDIKREPKVVKKLVIPKGLQRVLPYKDKPKVAAMTSKSNNDERVTVINSPYEQKVSKMMHMLETNYREKKIRLKKETKERLKNFRQMKKAEDAHKLKHQKLLRKKVSRAISKMRKKQNPS